MREKENRQKEKECQIIRKSQMNFNIYYYYDSKFYSTQTWSGKGSVKKKSTCLLFSSTDTEGELKDTWYDHDHAHMVEPQHI